MRIFFGLRLHIMLRDKSSIIINTLFFLIELKMKIIGGYFEYF